MRTESHHVHCIHLDCIQAGYCCLCERLVKRTIPKEKPARNPDDPGVEQSLKNLGL